MECDTICKAKKHTNEKNIKSKIQTSQDENNDLKKALKNKDIYEVKCKKKNISNEIKVSQEEDSDSMEKSENEDTYEIKNKNVWNRKRILSDQDSDSKEESENKDTYEVKCKKRNIENAIKVSPNKDNSMEESGDTCEIKYKTRDNRNKTEILQDEDDNLKKELKHDIHKLKSKDEDIGKEIKTLQNENNDMKKALKDKDTCEVKYKKKNIRNEIKVSQEEDSDLMKKSENKDTYEIKNKNVRNRKRILSDEDSDSKEESENKDTYEVKCKKRNIENAIKVSPNKDNSMEESEDTNKIKRKDEDNRDNKTETLQDEDDNLKKELKNDKLKFKKNLKKGEDIGKVIKMLQNENTDAKEALNNKDTRKVDESDEDVIDDYCSDATYLARQMSSAERLDQAESKQLYNLNVQLIHAVPPQHEIETRAGSHMPTREEIEQFERLIPIKRGSYSLEEDKIIATNWKAFCKLHNWDIKMVKPFLQLRINRLTYMRNTTERRKFVQFLSAGLPNRTLYSVYHRFRNLYEDNVQRRYKPEEDEMIINHLEHNPSLDKRRKYSDLAKVLRRTRHSIWRRYRILKKKNEKYEDD